MHRGSVSVTGSGLQALGSWNWKWHRWPGCLVRDRKPRRARLGVVKSGLRLVVGVPAGVQPSTDLGSLRAGVSHSPSKRGAERYASALWQAGGRGS